jgi:predicted nuclease of predicted toxin-antitoxin system
VRLFLDQMFRVGLAEQLRVAGHDVVRAGEVGLNRADDADILAQAVAQQRILVTLDRHFGDWAVLPLRAHPGVIRVRVHPTTTENVLRVLTALLAGRAEEQFLNHLVIASPPRVRWIQTTE